MDKWEMNMKIKKFAETGYILALIVMACGAAMMARANLGVSIVVAPAYILHLKFAFLTYGQAEYLVQAALLVGFCTVIKRFHWTYLLSFVTALIYGVLLDQFMRIFAQVAIGSMTVRIILFSAGVLLTASGVAMFFRTYCPPEVYELFVKGVSRHFNIGTTKMKIAYDITSCVFAILLSFLLLGQLQGVGVGTIICAFINGLLIGLFGKIYDKFIDFGPAFPGLKDKIWDKGDTQNE